MNTFRSKNGNSTNHKFIKRALLLIPPVLACFALLPAAKAALNTHDTADGTGALASESGGDFNSAFGFDALNSNTTSIANTAIGAFALDANNGNDNTATGFNALFSNTTGNDNTATGAFALNDNTTGSDNTANGRDALGNNTTGNFNTATGFIALSSNTEGGLNTATGVAALLSNTTGIHNTANGDLALVSNTTGNFNTTDGAYSLVFNTGSQNVALGFAAGQNLTTGSNNVDVASAGVAGESNTIRIGNQMAFTDLNNTMHPAHTKIFIAGISGVTSASGIAVLINSNGQLGTTTSSKRFKEDIRPMDKASEAILALKPVAFRYKKEIDPKGLSQFGLVAEDVEKVNPALVALDKEGKPYAVRYEQVNAMLLNEFLKEHRKVEQQGAIIAKQQKQIDALTRGLQKVNDQLELRKPGPQTVVNNQ
jgi:hypothetical protein